MHTLQLFPLQAHEDFPSLNIQASESSKDDECNAICKLHGVDPMAPLPLQLKAIDNEYHSCLAAGQSAKADHVMSLFAWKSKQASQVWHVFKNFHRKFFTIKNIVQI